MLSKVPNGPSFRFRVEKYKPIPEFNTNLNATNFFTTKNAYPPVLLTSKLKRLSSSSSSEVTQISNLFKEIFEAVDLMSLKTK